jgi:hypothetical protein
LHRFSWHPAKIHRKHYIERNKRLNVDGKNNYFLFFITPDALAVGTMGTPMQPRQPQRQRTKGRPNTNEPANR